MTTVDIKNITIKVALINFAFILSPNSENSFLYANPENPHYSLSTLPPSYTSIINAVPSYVYRASLARYRGVFDSGFVRTRARVDDHTFYPMDLSEYLRTEYMSFNYNFIEFSLSELSSSSGFISTTADREFAIYEATELLYPYLNLHDDILTTQSFYVYQIVPQDNFISVIDNYERALAAETNPERFQNLVQLDPFYTRGNQYIALNSIQPENIVSATRFYFDLRFMGFVEGESFSNPAFHRNFTASIYHEEYPLGTVPNARDIRPVVRESTVCEVQIYQLEEASTRKKRDLKKTHERCQPSASREVVSIKMPKDLFEKNSVKIKVNVFNQDNYCLVTYDNHLSVTPCDSPYLNNRWIYTEFSQLIAEVYDGENMQYYCLTAPQDEESQNVKMAICDLNNKEQIWNFKESADSKHLLASSGKTIGFWIDHNVYLSEESENINPKKPLLEVKNFLEIQDRISPPLIQFSVETKILNRSNQFHFNKKSSFDVKKHFLIYPRGNGYVKNDDPLELTEYRNYYNAHNNAFFSNYGYKNGGPQVCYYSNLVAKKGSSWDWVKNDYCSTQNDTEPQFKWYFKKVDDKENYKIVDEGNNVFRTSGSGTYAYTANLYWTESNEFFQNFKFSSRKKLSNDNLAVEKVLAVNSFIAEKLAKEQSITNKKYENIFVFNALYQYFRSIYPVIKIETVEKNTTEEPIIENL